MKKFNRRKFLSTTALSSAAISISTGFIEDENNIDALRFMGILAFKSGNHDIAEAMFTKALNLDPSYSLVWANLAQVFSVTGQLHKAKKSFKNIDSVNNQGKKTVIINRQSSKFPGKGKFSKGSGYKSSSTNYKKIDNFKTNFKINNPNSGISDFEKRKLAEQRATRRLKGETAQKDNKTSKISGRRRELKLTISRALSEDIEFRSRSLASIKRAREKELRETKNKC